jgi:Putative transposase
MIGCRNPLSRFARLNKAARAADAAREQLGAVVAVSRVFRGKFHDALKRALENGQLNFHGDLKLLAQPKIFAAWLRPLFRKTGRSTRNYISVAPTTCSAIWAVTHRVAISNHRLVSFADHKVTFRWPDSAHNNEQRLMTLSLDEFPLRFLLQVLPDSFVRIRNFGSLANRRRAPFLPLCFSLLGSAPRTEQGTSDTKDFHESLALYQRLAGCHPSCRHVCLVGNRWRERSGDSAGRRNLHPLE